MSTHPPVDPSDTSRPSTGATILVVEDQPQIRRLLAVSLEHAGYEVLIAGDGEEALALAADPGQRIDLLVSDVMMPGINGPQLAARLREAGRDVPVVLISGFTSDVAMPDEGPGVTFLQKPFALADLAAAVRAALASGES